MLKCFLFGLFMADLLFCEQIPQVAPKLIGPKVAQASFPETNFGVKTIALSDVRKHKIHN